MSRLNSDRNSDHQACQQESTFEVEKYVVCDDVYGRGRTFEVVVPVLECFEDSKQFLIVGVIVQLQSSQGSGVVGNWTNLSVSASDRQDASNSIVEGISFHDNRGVQNEVSEDGCSSEGMLQHVEGALTVLREVPRSIFPGEPGKRDHDVRVIEDKPVVEVRKPKKDWMSFTFQGLGQSEMVWILSRDIVKPSGER